ncbi:hypothetical protein ACOZ4B_06820 [Haloferax prahovense]|nr:MULTISPECIES: hypothetical protein [unclassified Haloferax]MCO8267286.1 hypothetical protein [Haloferax sp. AB510]
MRDSSLMRDALGATAVERAYGLWCTLERGWRATALGLVVVTVLVALGP